MSTHKETKKSVPVNFRITEEMNMWIKKFHINVSDTCRQALTREIEHARRSLGGVPASEIFRKLAARVAPKKRRGK